MSTWFNSMSLQHAAQTGRGRVFLGINSWQHTEGLPTCATAQKSCVNPESGQDALGRVTAGLSSCGPIENHTQSSGCSLEGPQMNYLGFQLPGQGLASHPTLCTSLGLSLLGKLLGEETG